MFRVVLRMHVVPGREERFLDIVRTIGAAVSANPSNRGQRVFQDDTGVFHVYSDWADDEAFWAHERSTEHRRLIGAMREVREDSTMTTMSEVDVFDGRPLAQPAAPTSHAETSSSGVADS